MNTQAIMRIMVVLLCALVLSGCTLKLSGTVGKEARHSFGADSWVGAIDNYDKDIVEVKEDNQERPKNGGFTYRCKKKGKATLKVTISKGGREKHITVEITCK